MAVIAIDFDGTVVRHEYPQVGKEVFGAVSVMEKLIKNGHQLILHTMRSEDYLKHATDWFDQRGIVLWGVNVNPEQKEWTSSTKTYAQVYIDDAGLGTPLIKPTDGRPYVDWQRVETMLKMMKLI